MARSTEWDCEHGVGHPWPQWMNRTHHADGIHGCDGCCQKVTPMKYVIDRIPVPIPEKHQKSPTYPWSELEVGGSFFVGLGPPEVRKADANRMFNAMRYQNKKGPKKFDMRIMGDVIRVWRIE